ncbi:MAG: ATP phosphoribosyltransferase [Flavobacteriaceae bacterium]|nr:ATP phosphoribosyltransferase [Flavobacteriaceae bacterium]|tara:strand:+ start:2649 stop:3500 length:852 start_codon:yes stop_codon:yes gene_type:complete
MIKIAIQKSGRLNEESLNLIKDCGINFEIYRDQLKVISKNYPIEIYFLRNGDIPKYLNDGVVDLAIIGENTLSEKGYQLKIIEKLGFSKCRVSLAIPNDFKYESINDLNNIRIATSYPNILKKFLKKENIKSDLHIINGSVEISPSIGLSDAICDIVSSGSTLFENNLIEVVTLLESEAVLVQSGKVNKKIYAEIKNLTFRIKSVLLAKKFKYILMNAPNKSINKISKILPVLKSPTVLPLAKDGWSSIHSVINYEDFWNIIDKLKKEGAEDILVCPIEKMVI